MRRFAVFGVAVCIGVLAFAPSGLAASGRVAALQIGLRAHGFDPGPIDGVRGQLTDGRPASLPAGATGYAPRVSSDAARGGRCAPEDDRCSVNESSGSARSAGTSPCSSSGCGATGSAREPWTGGSRAPRAWRFVATSRAAGSRRTASPARRPIARSRDAARPRQQTRWHVVQPGESFFSICRALPRQPVAARSAQRSLADERDRPGSAARSAARSAADGAGRGRPARQP